MNIRNVITSVQHNEFFVNRYLKLLEYCSIVNDNTKDVYFEKHHILPKSIWPEYDKCNDNIIKLTARQHYIAHYILSKMFVGKNNSKMCFAFSFMISSNSNYKRYTSHLYELSKVRISKIRKKSMTGERNPFYKKTHSAESIEKMRVASTGRKQSPETIEKRFKTIKGKPRPQNVKDKISKSNKGNKSALGSKRSQDTKDVLSLINSGSNNPSAMHYIIVDPLGNEYSVHGELQKFCKEHSLSLQKMKTSINLGAIVLTNPKYKYTTETKNCVGWLIRTAD